MSRIVIIGGGAAGMMAAYAAANAFKQKEQKESDLPQEKNEVILYEKNEKDLALDIFSEVATKAAIDVFEVERVKADKLYSIKTAKNTPDTLAFDEFKTALWEGTPYVNTGKVL